MNFQQNKQKAMSDYIIIQIFTLTIRAGPHLIKL